MHTLNKRPGTCHTVIQIKTSLHRHAFTYKVLEQYQIFFFGIQTDLEKKQKKKIMLCKMSQFGKCQFKLVHFNAPVTFRKKLLKL